MAELSEAGDAGELSEAGDAGELSEAGDAGELSEAGDAGELSEAGDAGELSEAGDARSGEPRDAATVRELRARVAELERLLDARTQAIVGMGARLAELQGDAPPPLADRVRELEEELRLLRATKVIRYSEAPRRIYGRLRRGGRG